MFFNTVSHTFYFLHFNHSLFTAEEMPNNNPSVSHNNKGQNRGRIEQPKPLRFEDHSHTKSPKKEKPHKSKSNRLGDQLHSA